MNIRVGTFNILNTSCRYQERKELVRDTIKQMDCDVLGLQEINYNENLELFDLETYNLYFASLPTPMLKSEPEFRID
jgi:mRNA deadenylase 3'-5' endonuclease subunit Ccr4